MKDYLIFQSTQPEWAATSIVNANSIAEFAISIHAARVGCDSNAVTAFLTVSQFQSTQPEWAATKLLMVTLKML